LYDKDNLLIAKTEGETFVNPNGRQTIFSPGIEVGNRVPVRTVFTFTKQPIWYKSVFKMSELELAVSDIRKGDTNGKPYITAIIKNNSDRVIPKFDVFALVYDDNNNVRAVSRTVVDGLQKDEQSIVSFTWNSSFGDGVLRYVIEPVVDTAMLSYANK
jgi:hypothetical protein